MSSFVTVIGCGSKARPKVLTLRANNHVYLFNCGDGCLNSTVRNKSYSSVKLKDIFVTSYSYENVAGIYGQTLEKKKSGEHVTIHCAPGMKEILKVSIMFAEDRLFSSVFTYRDISDGVYEDVNLTAEYVPITSKKVATLDVKGSNHVMFHVRRCHMTKDDESTYGLSCLTKHEKPGYFVGKIQHESSAEMAGLKRDDRIIEINGKNIEELTYSEVIDMIKESGNNMDLLVVNMETDQYCKDNDITVSSTMEETDELGLELLYDCSGAKQICVKNFSSNVTESTILDLLDNKDRVEKVILPWMSYKGQTYINFKSREDAVAAVVKLDNMMLGDQTLKAKHLASQTEKNLEQKRVYLGNLPYNATKEDIQSLLPDHLEKIRVQLNLNKYTNQNNIGDCFIYCEDKETLDSVKSSLKDCTLQGRKLYMDSSVFDDKVETYNNDTHHTRPAVGYIVKLKKDLPHFNPDVLKAHNLKPGPFIRDIIKGKNVTVNGVELKPEDCLIDADVIRPFIVVDCPTVDYLDSLLAAEQYTSLNSDPDTVPQLVVHFSPATVVSDPRYQQFIQRFNTDKTFHFMMNENSPAHTSSSLIKANIMKNKINSTLFPPFQCETLYEKPEGNIIQAVSGLKYSFKPLRYSGVQWEDVMNSSLENIEEEALQENKYRDEFELAVQQTQSVCREMEKSTQNGSDYPVFTFLGTGSAQPSVHRNQSCILVETSQDEFIILDCGEGVLERAYLMFGEKKAEDILCNLKAVFISHLHYDHHGGLLPLAKKRHEIMAMRGREDKLLVIAPGKYIKFLNLIDKSLLNTSHVLQFVPMVFRQAHKEHSFDSLTSRTIQLRLNVRELTPVPVDHISGSFGVYIHHDSGWRLMYSGDTRPCTSLILKGYQQTDYLIHEATFANHEKDMASQKKHSTIDQAIQIGEKMEAKHIILTHFSQKYSKNPIFADITDGVAFAYDFIQLTSRTIPMMTHLKGALCLGIHDGINPIFETDLLGRLSDELRTTQNQVAKKREQEASIQEETPSCKVPKLVDKWDKVF